MAVFESQVCLVAKDRDSYKASNPKLTYIKDRPLSGHRIVYPLQPSCLKEYCGCEARYVHFVRPASQLQRSQDD